MQHPMRVFSSIVLIVTVILPLYGQKKPVAATTETRIAAIEREINTISEDLSGAEGRYLSPFTMNRDYNESPAKKIEKADFYFQRKDYISSGGIYYSLFSSRKEKDFIWEEALFKLAESLFLNNNYISAARYYEMLLTDRPYSRYQIDSLKRLIASAYHLGEYSKAKTYYSEFINIGYDISRDQELLYFLGKSLFFDKQYEEARDIFKTVRKESTYYPQSLYFLGAIHIQLGQMDQAVPFFKSVLDVADGAAYFKYEQVRDLAIVALGRLLFEKGDFTGATDHYLKLDRSSEFFAQAYFELCWAYIKREQYDKALEALRLIKYIAPGSIVQPQSELLEGNLLIRMRRYGDAMVLFNKVVKEYADIRDQLNTLKKSGSSLLDDANASGETQLSVYAPLVRSLLKDNKKYTHAVRLQDDLKSIEKELEQISKLEGKLATIIGNKNAAAIFPPLKQGTEMALSFQNRLVHLRDEALKLRAEKGLGGLDAKDRERYGALEKEKAQLQKKLQDLLPQSSRELEEKVSQYAEQILALEEELHRATIRLRTLYDQLDAIGAYYLKSASQSGAVDQRVMDKIEQEKKRIVALTQEVTRHKQDTEEEKNRLLLGGDILSRMIIARDSYGKIVTEQEQLLESSTTVPPADRERLDALHGRIDDMSRQASVFHGKLNEVIGGIIQNIKDSFESEKMKIEEYKSQLLALKRETAETAAMAMYTNISKVNRTFDDLVLQADLGIIDVAWEKKEESTQTLNKLRTRMAEEIQELYLNLENLE